MTRDPNIPLAFLLGTDDGSWDPIADQRDRKVRELRRCDSNRRHRAARHARRRGELIERAFSDDLLFVENMVRFLADDPFTRNGWESLLPKVRARINQWRNRKPPTPGQGAEDGEGGLRLGKWFEDATKHQITVAGLRMMVQRERLVGSKKVRGRWLHLIAEVKCLYPDQTARIDEADRS